MSSKSFVKMLVAVVVLFFIANVVLYFGFVTSDGLGANPKVAFRGSEKSHGDLCTIASKHWPDSATPQKKYAASHLEISDYIARRAAGEDVALDVLTIGDSFTNGASGAYYQDYMAERYGLTVLNIKTVSGLEALDMVRLLADSGYLAELKPRVIIVESVERALASRYDRSKAPKIAKMNVPQLQKALSDSEYADKKDESMSLLPGVMVKQNVSYLKSRYKNLRGSSADTVSFAALNTAVFSTASRADELMYYTDDIRNTGGDAARIEQSIAPVAELCREQGIEFVFLPCPDKFTVYYPYVIDDGHNYPDKRLLDDMLAQPRSYYMVDAKGILRAAAARGELDLYWADDTHWSWRGFELVVDDMMQHIF